MEVWKPINDYEGHYEVSSLGRVRSLDRVVSRRGHKMVLRGCILKPFVNKSIRYHTVGLRINGVRSTKYVHRLVCESFHGPQPPGMEVSHADDRPENNRACNLSWQTRTENMAVRGALGGHMNGEKNGNTKLTDACACIIIAMLSDGKRSQSEIAKIFGVSKMAINRISLGRSWRHLPRPVKM